jgi:2'-5' RNA ligase
MKARLFVALELPDAVREALVAWRAPLLRDADELRAVAPEALHVTLAFLGWQPEEAIAPLAELVDVCAADGGGASGLALGKPLWLPRRRPRVLAIALEDRHGQLAALQERLVARLTVDGWYEPEARPYLPHVTVARVRARAPSRARELPTPAFGDGAAPEVVFDGTAVVLYRSHLSSAGTRYEPLSVNRLA